MVAPINVPPLWGANKWSGQTITYMFLDQLPIYATGHTGFLELSPAQKQATEDIIAYIQSFLGVQLVKMPQGTDPSQIDIAIGLRNMPDDRGLTQLPGPLTGGDGRTQPVCSA